MDKKYCRGCYNDIYNHGAGGASECWHLRDAKLVLRKKVHINQRPPWKQQAELYPDCYTQPQYIFVKPDRDY